MKKFKDNRLVKREELNETYYPEKIKEGFQREFHRCTVGFFM
jgi:hypothetical protein